MTKDSLTEVDRLVYYLSSRQVGLPIGGFMENKVKWHYRNPDDKELKNALKELNEK